VGGLFDPAAERGRIVSRLAPAPGESIVEKGLPNAFAGTDLHDRIAATGRINLVLAGFMTHMCVSSTARAALDFGYRVTIDSNSCATRDLPDGCGGIVAAALLNEVALVELSDRFALISRTIGALE
jgi:nicotinamidase-related amidase